MREPPYDLMRDVVVRAGIRDTMIADMAQALQAIADWPTTSVVCDYDQGIGGVQEFAEQALRRYREAQKRI